MFRHTITKAFSGRGHACISRAYATIPQAIGLQVGCIRASPPERQAGRLTERNLEAAVRHVLKDGLVVIQNAIDADKLDQLNGKMVDDTLQLSRRGKDSPFNYNQGNLQQDAPPMKKYFEPSIFLNPLATQVTSSILGPNPKLTFMSGNSAMPASDELKPQRQPVHSDADFTHPSHPFALVVNVPLVTMTPENGSTEVWLGTHSEYGLDAQEGAHGDRASGRILSSLLDERRRISPPLQPVVHKGSVIIRDLRLWHAGMPNYSQSVRIMLAMIHFAPWYRNQMKLELGNSVKALLDQSNGLDIRADFIPDEEAEARYLHRAFGNAYDFRQDA